MTAIDALVRPDRYPRSSRREYGVHVVAADLWVGPDEAAAVFAEADGHSDEELALPPYWFR